MYQNSLELVCLLNLIGILEKWGIVVFFIEKYWNYLKPVSGGDAESKAEMLKTRRKSSSGRGRA
jgi:hypothetical protein